MDPNRSASAPDSSSPSNGTESSKCPPQTTENSSRLTKESINQQLVDSIVKSVMERRKEREAVTQLARKRSISEDKEDFIEPEKEVNDGAVMEVSSFSMDHPTLDLNKDKEWLEHYRQSQNSHHEQVRQPGLFRSIASTLRSAIDLLNPFKRVEIGKQEVNSNPFIFVNGKKEVNPAYLDYVHYRKQHPLPSALKEKPSFVQTKIQSGYSAVPDVKLFLPSKQTSSPKSCVSSAANLQNQATEQAKLNLTAKAAFPQDEGTEKVEVSKPKVLVTGHSSLNKDRSEEKKCLKKATQHKRCEDLFH